MSKKTHPTRMKKGDLKHELEADYGYDLAALKKLSRPELATLVRENRSGKEAQKIFDDLDKIDTETICEQVTVDSAKEKENTDSEDIQNKEASRSSNKHDSPHSPYEHEWIAYVLNLLEDDEMIEGNPRVDGLRRLVEKLIGDIIEEQTEIIECPNIHNGFRAVVKATIIVESHENHKRKRYDGAADVSNGNCEQEYARFAVSTAETRARGRALKTALKLRQIIAAEEATNVPIEYSLNEGDINASQISAIKILCDRNKVSITKMLQHLEIKKEDLKTLTQEEAVICMQNLNKWRQNPNGVPEQLLRD